MMGIEQICNTIKNVFQAERPPAPQISRILIVCSMIKRPGLSTIVSSANVVKALNKLGFPTGTMPDGSENKTVMFVYTILKEIFRAIKFDMSIQTGTMIGSQAVQVGPAAGFNTTPGQGFAVGH